MTDTTPGDRRQPDHDSGRRAPHDDDSALPGEAAVADHRAPAGAPGPDNEALDWEREFATLIAGLTEIAGLTDQTGDGDGDQLSGPRGPSDDPADHYEPPPSPPVPRIHPITRWALCSLALGIGILLAPAVAGLKQNTGRDVAGVMLVLGGAATLVARLGDRPPTDSDGDDDGAVV
jgi:hypothetical protein